MSLSAQQAGIVVDTLRRALGDGVVVYQFGSSVAGQTHSGSDLDVAVLAPQRLGATERFDLQEGVAASLGRDVDLVDLRSASTVMAMQVVSTGRVLFDGVPESRGAFEDRTFGSCARLNEERRERVVRRRTRQGIGRASQRDNVGASEATARFCGEDDLGEPFHDREDAPGRPAGRRRRRHAMNQTLSSR